MKKIILLRHAKSSWKDSSINDHERPLNKRGKNDVSIMAKHFNNKNIKLDLIISSSAKRSFETAKVFGKVFGMESKFMVTEILYEASSEKILRFINQIDDNYNNVLLVCHNPGITNLANYLSDFFVDNIPTTGMVGFSFDNSWKNIKEKNCSFLFFDYPKKYY